MLELRCSPKADHLLTLDTSAVVALLDRREPRHAAVRGALEADRGPFVVPASILAEVAHMLVRRLGPAALDGFLADLEDGGFRPDFGDHDLGCVRVLMTRYSSLALALADAAVIACTERTERTERTGSSVLTIDRRDFDVVGRDNGITVVPA